MEDLQHLLTLAATATEIAAAAFFSIAFPLYAWKRSTMYTTYTDLQKTAETPANTEDVLLINSDQQTYTKPQVDQQSLSALPQSSVAPVYTDAPLVYKTPDENVHKENPANTGFQANSEGLCTSVYVVYKQNSEPLSPSTNAQPKRKRGRPRKVA